MDFAFGFYSICSGAFLASSVMLATKPAVSAGYDVLVSLRSCKMLPFKDFFVLLLIMQLDVVDISAMAFFFAGEATSRLLTLIFSTSCVELWSVLLRRLTSTKQHDDQIRI